MHRERKAWVLASVERGVQFLAPFISGDHFY
jgi:hypothetical protein